jgi:hypothetical protein
MLINSSKGRYHSQHDTQFDRCRNCEKMGHTFKNCNLDQQMRCHYCLQNHKREQCELNYCFVCAKRGHRSNNCPHKHDRGCRRCSKRGHLEADCSILMNFKVISSRTTDILKENQKNLLCLNCGEHGHIQCYLKGSHIISQILKDDLYNREQMKITSVELNLGEVIEEEDLHPKVILSKNQQRKRLNQLMHEEVEDRTLQSFAKYSQEQERHKPSMAKRPPEKENFRFHGQEQYTNHPSSNRYGHNKHQYQHPRSGHGRRKYR